MKTYTCKHCTKEFESSSKKPPKFCSDLCRKNNKIEQKFVGKIAGYHYVICPVCEQKTRQINNVHALMHGFSSPRELADKFGVELTCQEIKENSQGENNPAFGHGGKYSKWSKNFLYGYDAEAHKRFRENHSKRRNDKSQKHKYMTNLEYWLNKFDGDEEKANQAYTEFQTRDLNYFINKYGEEEGKTRHALKIQRWLTTLDNKTVEEKSEINRKKLWKNGNTSKGEKQLVEELSFYLDNIESQVFIRKNESKWYIYDIAYKNKIIEYNGDYWHANPKKYNKFDKFCRSGKEIVAEDIWKSDEDKINNAKINGYQVHVVWESDFKKNKDKVIQECLNFLRT